MSTTYNDLLFQALEAKKKQDKQAALVLLKNAIDCDPKQFLAYKEAAIICKELKLIDDAMAFIEQALVINPGNLIVEIQKAICERYLGDSQKCLGQLLALAEKNPSNVAILLEVAQTFKGLNELESAQIWLKKALGLAPTNLNILLESAYLARLQGDSGLAAERYLAVMRHHPENPRGYIEYATELQALDRYSEGSKTLKSGVIYCCHQKLFEKYLLSFFEINPLVASQELLLQAPYYKNFHEINLKFLDYLVSAKEVIDLTGLPIALASNLFGSRDFVVRLMNFIRDRSGNFTRLMAYFEPLLEVFTENEHKSLVSKDLFIFFVHVASLKKNNKFEQYVADRVGDYVGLLGFDDICFSIKALTKSLNDEAFYELFAKGVIEKHSIDALLFCLIIVDYYPHPTLALFNDRDFLFRVLPSVNGKSPAILKNILVHLLQKELLSLEQLDMLNIDPLIKDAVKAVDAQLKPVFNPNCLHYSKPKKLKVALCISGQLRGYREGYESLKKAFIDPLQPDIYVHTWQDVGFKEPLNSKHADRLFSGHFLEAYRNLFKIKNYSYSQIKQLLPSVFSLLQNNTSIDKAQLQAFYQTECVEIEDDAAPPFSAFSNTEKMFYKIHACNQLVAKSGKQYDLVIRARPDVKFNLEYELDWLAMAEACNTQKIIWADASGEGFIGFTNNGGYITGDCYAISSQAGLDFYANVGMSVPAFKKQGLAFFSVVSPHTILGHGLWLGGYRRQSIPIGQRLKFMNISLKAEDIYTAIQADLVNMDKDLANDFMRALALDMAGVPYEVPSQLETSKEMSELQPIKLCSPPTTAMLEQQLLAQFDQDPVIASYDMMLYAKYYDFKPELIGRYFQAIMDDCPVTPLAANASLSRDFISSDWFINAFQKMKGTEHFAKLSAFFSTFILESVADGQARSKNLDLLVDMIG